MARQITSDDIILINKAYLECKTYAGAARKTGFSAGTVKKYIIPDFKENLTPITWNKELPEPGTFTILTHILTPEEWKEIEELRKDILI